MDSIIPIAAAFDAYTNWDGLFIRGGHYSVTDLLDSPRIVQLKKRHRHELPPAGVEDLLSAFQGNAWHSAMEKNLRRAAAKPEWRNRFLIEAKFWERVEGRKITGKLDCYDAHTNTLYDFKVTSTYKAIFGDYTDWEVQLNVYAWFLKLNEFAVDAIKVICIHPTWNKYEMMKDPKYPRHPIHEVPLRVWPFEEQEELIKVRVRALRESEPLADDDLPPCTDKDMWIKETRYAIKEEGKKRATRVVTSQAEVDKYLAYKASTGHPLGPHTVEVRPGERTRCNNYCSVNVFCSQHHAALAEEEMG
jgi:hypothetical protein